MESELLSKGKRKHLSEGRENPKNGKGNQISKRKRREQAHFSKRVTSEGKNRLLRSCLRREEIKEL